MKKLLLIALILVGCEKDHKINDNIDLPLLISFLNETEESFRADFPYEAVWSGFLGNGDSLLRYVYFPGDLEFILEVVFEDNIAKIMDLRYQSKDYEEAIKITKILSARLQEFYKDNPYSASYHVPPPDESFITFTNSTEYWDYVDQNPVTSYIVENRDIENIHISLYYRSLEGDIVIHIWEY